MDASVEHSQAALSSGLPLVVVLLVLAAAVYLGAVVTSNRRGQRTWPMHRTVLWVLGPMMIAATLIGPLAERSHTHFAAHLAAHLLIGMLAPMLFVLAAPITLALRTLRVGLHTGWSGCSKAVRRNF